MARGYLVYGLREAKKVLREMREAVKGQSGDYMRGYRSALNEAERLIQTEIDQAKSPADE